MSTISRRAALAASLAIIVRPALAAEWQFRQFHNQAENSPVHRHLVQMWARVKAETNGRVETTVFAENGHIPGSDPAALRMVISGELDFFTLMGGILGQAVPVAEIQQVPFAFRTESEAHASADGPLGAYLRQEMRAKGLFGFPVMAFDNGMRQTAVAPHPILRPEDFAGIRIRLPAGQLFTDTFRALGAEPVTINVNQIYDSIKAGKADAQENPLAVTEVFRLYEVTKYMAMTNHMWSGFNLMANLGTWSRLPENIRDIIVRAGTDAVRAQRAEQVAFNAGLAKVLAGRGMVFNTVNPSQFRERMGPVYATWKANLGSKAWGLLEAQVGRLA